MGLDRVGDLVRGEAEHAVVLPRRLVGGSYGISFWNMIVLPFSPVQKTS